MAKKYDKERLIAEWKTGGFSQRQLANRYGISPSMVAKLTKGVSKESEQLVSTIVQTKQELADKTEKEAMAISEQVEQRLRHIQFINNATLKNASEMMKKVGKNTTHQEHKFVQETLVKAGETLGVIDKGGAQVNINNTNAQQNSGPVVLKLGDGADIDAKKLGW